MLKKHWLVILLAFVLPLLGVFAWWGGFSRVHIGEAERGPYHFAYLEHQGDLSRLPQTQARVRALLDEQKLARGASITVLLTDPRKVQRGEVKAQTGYLIAPTAAVQSPLKRGEIPARRVLVARVRAAALLAPSKAYQALYEHLAAQGMDIRMPTVEIYDSPPEIYRVGELSVEMER